MAQPNNTGPDQGGSPQQGDTRNDIQWQQDDPDQQQRNPDQQNPDSGSDKTMGREQEDDQKQSGQEGSQGTENR